MTITIPLRVPQEMIEKADEVIEDRHGAPSRNAVLREMIARGFKDYEAEQKGRK